MTAFRIYLRVVSESLLPAEITSMLRVMPDEATEIGSRRRPESPPSRHSTWTRNVEAGNEAWRPEDFEPTILAWGFEFAEALGRIVAETDVVVSLEIVQEISDIESRFEKGIFLSPALIAWLSVARASLDIDQYI